MSKELDMELWSSKMIKIFVLVHQLSLPTSSMGNRNKLRSYQTEESLDPDTDVEMLNRDTVTLEPPEDTDITVQTESTEKRLQRILEDNPEWDKLAGDVVGINLIYAVDGAIDGDRIAVVAGLWDILVEEGKNHHQKARRISRALNVAKEGQAKAEKQAQTSAPQEAKNPDATAEVQKSPEEKLKENFLEQTLIPVRMKIEIFLKDQPLKLQSFQAEISTLERGVKEKKGHEIAKFIAITEKSLPKLVRRYWPDAPKDLSRLVA